MAMTRKHYIEAADNLNRILRDASPLKRKDAAEFVATSAHDMARMFKRDNGRFGYDTFYTAVFKGFEELRPEYLS